jgi:hypothetical protein
MFSTKGQEVKTGGGVQKSLQAGVVFAHIYSGNVRTSSKGDKKVLELTLEGTPLTNFEGWAISKENPEGPKFLGQSAKVTATSYTEEFDNPNPSKNDIMGKLAQIAIELGLRQELDTISASSIEDWVKQAIDILKDHNLYWFLKATEEEYNGKTIVKLSLPKYKFASQDENKLDKFDKNNVYHYKALPVNTSVKGFEPNDDFSM